MLLLLIASSTAVRIWAAVRLLLGLRSATAFSAASWASSRFCRAGMVRVMFTAAVLSPTVPASSARRMAPVILPAVPTVASVLL